MYIWKHAYTFHSYEAAKHEAWHWVDWLDTRGISFEMSFWYLRAGYIPLVDGSFGRCIVVVIK
jgi:hypothetical protein